MMYGYSRSTSSMVWYVSKGSDKIKELKTSAFFLSESRKDRKNEFAQLLEDKKDVYEKYIADGKFNFDQIRSILHLYNTGEWVDDFYK